MRSFEKGFGKLFVACHPSSINRPHFSRTWFDKDCLSLGLSWGNGNSDPVFIVNIDLRIPAWLEKRLP